MPKLTCPATILNKLTFILLNPYAGTLLDNKIALNERQIKTKYIKADYIFNNDRLFVYLVEHFYFVCCLSKFELIVI